MTGLKGTTILFDNNVVHRAVLARATDRDVLVFQVRPVAFWTSRISIPDGPGRLGMLTLPAIRVIVTPSVAGPKVFERSL